METLAQLLKEILIVTKEENHVGPIPIKISKKGNWEPMEKEIREKFETVALRQLFIIRSIEVLHDDDDDRGGFSRITANVLDANNVIDYVEILESKVDGGAVKILSSALNKAISMLDDYNNMYGDVMPKTQQISDLDETLKQYQ